MDGCWRVTITSDLTSAFPVLLQLSPEETEAIWDAVSKYILEELKRDKGVRVVGLGTFAVVQEQFHSKEEPLLVRRPFFELDIDELWLEEIYCPTELLPDGVKIEPLNYVQLSRATSFPLHVVKNCVQETILLYCFLLRSKEHVPFAFRDIGVLTCKDGFLCMNFYLDCVKRLESTAGLVALLHSRMWPAHLTAFSGETTARGIQMFPRFHLTVRRRPEAKASTTSQEEAAGERRMRRVSECHPGKLLQRRKRLSVPILTSWEPGTRQQDVEKKPSTSVLPPCPGSSPGTKRTDRQETAPEAMSTTTALPAPEASRRALQEVWNLSSQWDQTDCSWPTYQKLQEQARAEMAAWEAWSDGEDQQIPQRFNSQHAWTPHPPAQPRSKEVRRRWRKAENPAPAEDLGAAAKLERLRPDRLSPRARQVLERLEPHRHQQSVFRNVAEANRLRQEQQQQLPCARCWYRSGGEGAGNGDGGSSGALSKGAGTLPRFPPLNGK
ncbi:coiled-coil domain-containing protein 81-like [Anser cygnoides]|uniref:coiled-coil domain-containing protein 81-like n=1 Tax=Anser cygnoides TaxID=8845 RepID=UPI0034D21F0F